MRGEALADGEVAITGRVKTVAEPVGVVGPEQRQPVEVGEVRVAMVTPPGESNELDPEDAYLVIDNDPDPAELATEIAAFLVCQIENT